MGSMVSGEPSPRRAGAAVPGVKAEGPTGLVGRASAYLEPHRGGAFSGLDGCRAIAALGVVVYHVAGWANLTSNGTILSRFLNNLGNFGVAIFFLLSGFLLYRSFVSSWFRDETAPDPFRFIRHRLLRILPAYFVALGAFIALGLINNPHPRADFYFTLFSLTQIYRASYGFAGLTVAWTLCIEISFYMALPLMAALIRFIGVRARTLRMKLEAQLIGLGTLAVVAFIYRFIVAGPGEHSKQPQAVQLWLPNFLDWFALGMLLAVCVCWTDMGRELPRFVRQVANEGWLCWSLAAAFYFMLMMSRDNTSMNRVAAAAAGVGAEDTAQMFVRFGLNGLAAFFFLLPVVLGERSDTWIKRGLSYLVPTYLGTISYGIYLWHTVWLDYLKGEERFAVHWSFWIMLSAVLALTLSTASLSYIALERPVMRYRDPRRLRTTSKVTP